MTYRNVIQKPKLSYCTQEPMLVNPTKSTVLTSGACHNNVSEAHVLEELEKGNMM